MQLFVIGLLATSLLVKKAKAGVLLCVTLILLGNISLVFFTMNNISSPVLIDAEATREKTLNYLDYVHFSTYSHLSNFFIGILAAYTVTVEGFLLKNAKTVTILYNIGVALSCTLPFAPALHNTFGLLPQHLVPYYIVVIKFSYVFYYSLLIFTNINRYGGKKQVQLKSPKEVNPFMKLVMELTIYGNRWFLGALDYLYSAPLFRLIINLSYAVYVSNYFYVRFDFFTSRLGMGLATNTLYSIGNRVIYSMWFIILIALLFQLFFVAPFDAIRRRFKNKPHQTPHTPDHRAPQ